MTSSALEFRRLPVEPDQGLPQSFAVPIGGASYEFSLYASLPVDRREPLETIHDFASVHGAAKPTGPDGYVVLRIDRRNVSGLQTILLRKIVPDPALVHDAAELAVVVDRAQIARGNVNAAGRYGSQIDIWVALRWA